MTTIKGISRKNKPLKKRYYIGIHGVKEKPVSAPNY
jgi:hypothetical protein